MKRCVVRLFALLTILSSLSVQAETQLLDQVVAIVDEGVVLQSEVDNMVNEIKRNATEAGQSLPSDSALRVQVMDRLIVTSLQLQMAERMGIRVSDGQLEGTLASIASDQGKTLAQLREEMVNSGQDYETFRESVRNEIITGEVQRANVRRRIYISPQEIDSLIRTMEEQGRANQEYHVGHIRIEPNGEDEAAFEEAKQRAERVLAKLEDGDDFRRLALAASTGPKALEGGDWGWMNINEMPTLLVPMVEGKTDGDVVGPVRTELGYHIVKIFGVRGVEKVEITEFNSRHILLKPSIILSEERAESLLKDFQAQLREDDSKFAELAKAHSDDPGSGAKGGELGWADPDIYVPAFSSTLKSLDKGEISQPFRSMHGWHIVQLLDKRVLDATSQRQRDHANQLLFRRKFIEESSAWVEELRAKAYIEIVDQQG